MSRTILSRLGAGVVATALVAGGSLLVAAPASAANDVVTPNSVVENTWGTEGGLTVSGTGTPGDDLLVDITGTDEAPFTYFATEDKEVEVAADGTYTVTFAYTEEVNDFTSTPELGDTPFARIVNVTEGSEVEDVFLPIAVTAFVANDFTTFIDPICLSGVEAQTTGVTVSATGFGQFEEGVVYTLTDSAGTQIGDAEPVAIDETGSIAGTLTLATTINGVPTGPIADGVYTITFTGSVTTAGLVTIGNCDAPVAPVVPAAPAAPAAVAAAPQLANTGSSDAGILVGGSALLMLVGAALVVARRRQNAAA
jgi:LPXTG-motif cell wall-anchored protein